MHKRRYYFIVKHINWQNIRRDKQWDCMGSTITKENKAEGTFLSYITLPQVKLRSLARSGYAVKIKELGPQWKLTNDCNCQQEQPSHREIENLKASTSSPGNVVSVYCIITLLACQCDTFSSAGKNALRQYFIFPELF